MKQKMWMLGLFAVANVANAAGIIGTKASFAEGSLCKEYICELKKRAVETNGTISYHYLSKLGYTLVNRSKANTIIFISQVQPITKGTDDEWSGRLFVAHMINKYAIGREIPIEELNKCKNGENTVDFGKYVFECEYHGLLLVTTAKLK